MHRSVYAIIAVGVLAAGFLVGLLASWEPEPPLPNAGDFAHEAVAIERGVYDGAFTADYSVTWSDPVSVVTPPGLAGLVTASRCTPRSTVRSGDRILDVDGVGRVAFHTSLPFYRPLGPGDSGDDVAELRRALGAGGSGSVFDDDVARAVQQFNESIALPQGGATFEPSTVVFLPSPEVEVADCAIGIGHAVASGQEIFSTPAVPLILTVTPPVDVPQLEGPWVLRVGSGTAVPVDRGADGAFQVSDPEALEQLSLDPIVEEAQGAPASQATVALQSPVPVAIIPASSLFTSGPGTCAVIGTVDQHEAREVDVLRARLGTVEVSADDSEPISGTAVTNAPLLAAELDCPPS